ncbi:MAG: preprotein translocase subunit YajC [Thermaerobacter sp.]|nr:preprotein translocase subunit YajC [Bacillota bacterium]REJ38254.1 MAG: preprotein translocase subunit YajC [Bacillota bacterium]
MEQLGSLLPLLLVLALMWLMLIRPQQIQQRKRQEMLARIKRGDQVVTIGGIHGSVTHVTDDTIRLQVAEGVEITLNKNGVGFIKEEASDS